LDPGKHVRGAGLGRRGSITARIMARVGWYHLSVQDGMLKRALPPADSEIRPVLRARLLVAHAGEPDTVFLEEMGLCRGRIRVDLTVVNGILHGYEIKSDRDSLDRLPNQVDLYGRVLDRATLVVGERHLEDAIQMVPSWWGVLRVQATRGGPKLVMHRRSRENRDREARSLVELLWRADAVALLEQHGAARGLRRKPRRVVWDHVCKHVELHEIGRAVRAHLKTRTRTPGHPLPS
jgi:hypothetical protein